MLDAAPQAIRDTFSPRSALVSMRAMRFFHVFVLAGLALHVRNASAQDVWATPAAPGGVEVGTVSSTPVIVPAGAPETYEAAVLMGTRKIVQGDFEAALKELRAAATRAASRPEAFCRLGDAQLVSNDVPEARAAYENCQRFAKAEQNNREMALALIGIARTFERENKTKEERDAWQRVAANVADEGARALAQSRLLVLDAFLKQEAAYEVVRARIEERATKAAPTP